MERFRVAWIGGRWYIGEAVPDTLIESSAWLDRWLAQRGGSDRSRLDIIGGPAALQRFISDVGPLPIRE